MAINPNWPTMLYEWGPRWNCNGAAQPLDRYVEVTARTRGRAAVQRGRQYELDQVRAGTLDLQLANNDGALDPLNASGPWYGHIMPYQPMRIRAQWPPTVNLLTQVQATCGDVGGYLPGPIPTGPQGISVFSGTDSSGGSIIASGSAWVGTNVFQFSVPSTSTVTALPLWTPQVPPQAGVTYSTQTRVRNVTSATSMQVQALIQTYDANLALLSQQLGSTVTLTGSSSASWTQITTTSTVPTGAAYMVIGVALVALPASNALLQADGWQVEKNASPTTWVQPGVTYPIYSGFVERWPSSWDLQGTYGTVQPTAVDTFSLLSQRILRDPLTEEIYRRNPRFLFTLGDPQGSSSLTDSIGNFPPAPVAISKYGAGSLVSGTQITSASPGGTYTGSTQTVVTINNPSPGTALPKPASFISLGSSGILGPANPASWTRMIAVRYPGPLPSSAAYIWSCMDPVRGATTPNGASIFLYIDSAGLPNLAITGPGNVGSAYYFGGATNICDGNWHLLLFGYSTATAQVMASQDGSLIAYYSGIPASNTPTGLISDNVGGYVDATVGNGTSQNYAGDISYVAEFPTLFTNGDITSVYQAWKTSFAGDSSDARYQRILGWAGFSGPTNIQAGMTTSMGVAAVDGQDALSALQAVVDTENGAHYVDRTGVVVFKSRSNRYNALTPAYVLGENTAGGEIPYEGIALDFDPTRIANQVAVTQASSSQVFSAQDATSITNFFPRQLTRTVNSASTQECQDAANYLLSRYKSPAVRVSSVTLHPSANPSLLWPVCLSLELGTRIRVMRRPPAPAAAIQVDCFVENIAWEFGDDGEARVTLQCSPADLTPYGLFASFHTTLNTTIASGVSSIVIRNGADNTNPAAAQLGYGQQLVLGLGTANQEMVTIQSVGTTTSGWTTATITLQAATTKSHTAGVTVCEPLPTGVTDPTTWDATSKFDSIAFAY
ncbi:hypothetical protein [Kitasatospora sp. NPDC001175]|uniref:hypothetical protein n=1 Tax=Kitasatospora sp. NPDC001175 TaxID=3157103 RepID=UPI003D082D5C